MHQPIPTNRFRVLLAIGVIGLSLASAAQADRRFTYSYEAKTYTPGSIELETWTTWKTRDGFDRLDIRHEIEFGITERLQLGIYFADWRWENGEGSSFHDVAMEAIYNLTNPNTHWIGSSIYGEVKVWEDYLELESKLLLQKNFGKLAVVYNAIIEAEWEGDGLSEEKGEFAQTLGVAYQFDPKFSAGFEALHELEIAEWEEAGPSVVYVGPNASINFGEAFLTVAGLWQVTDYSSEPDFQLRTIFGFHF
ncbi:MAG: hypothetical protein ACI8XO_004910 [Verrucomicrobiales bacterium]|jgi:hypothetical protein